MHNCDSWDRGLVGGMAYADLCTHQEFNPDKTGLDLLKLDQAGLKWFRPNQTGSNHFTGYKAYQTGSTQIKPV